MKKNERIAQVILVLIAIAGVAVMGYLASLHYSHSESAVCNLGEGLSCSVVNTSKYAKVLGVPVSILGILYFAGVLLAGLFRFNAKNLKTILFLSIVFLGPSLYLTAIELFVLDNICLFCEISKLLIIGIIVTTAIALRPKKLIAQKVWIAIILGIVLAGIMYAVQIGGGTTKNYNTFAACLYDSGMRMYGSVSCSFCAKQRAMLGDAFKHIKEIECDPRNPHPQTELCVAKNISHTPTWIFEDENGEDIFRFEAGVQSLEALSEVSGCPLVEDAPTGVE